MNIAGAFIAVVAGLAVLLPAAIVGEVLLALRSRRRWGLVLPAAFLVLAAVFAFWFSRLFIGVRLSLPVFLVSCIPALILLGVYAICRHVVKRRRVDEVKQMEIQDL